MKNVLVYAEKNLKKMLDVAKCSFKDVNIEGFDNPKSIAEYISYNEFVVAIIYVNSKVSMSIAKKIREIDKKVNIIVVADNDDYAVDSLDIRVSGYVKAPLTEKKLKEEIDNLRTPIDFERVIKLRCQCFGNFDVFDNCGNIIHFLRSKSKELFAYLVSKNGTSVSIKEVCAVLFEDMPYDKKQQHYIQQIISSMLKTLRDFGAENVVIKSYNALSVDPRKLDCDYYRFLNNDKAAKRLYNGEFMIQYEWADNIGSFLENELY